MGGGSFHMTGHKLKNADVWFKIGTVHQDNARVGVYEENDQLRDYFM